jgi:hypothetical protein
MTFSKGEIVRFTSAQAGYPKFHLCVLECVDARAAQFLFINSGSGFAGDFVVADSEIPCIAPSPTGKSVISCSQIVRANAHQLKIFKATKVGDLPAAVARKFEAFVRNVPTLNRAERTTVLAALEMIK